MGPGDEEIGPPWIAMPSKARGTVSLSLASANCLKEAQVLIPLSPAQQREESSECADSQGQVGVTCVILDTHIIK